MAKYILGIDEGTTGARAFVIDDQCEVLGLAAAELRSTTRGPAGSSTTRWRSSASSSR